MTWSHVRLNNLKIKNNQKNKIFKRFIITKKFYLNIKQKFKNKL